MELVFTFQQTRQAIGAEKALLAQDIAVQMMPLPSQLGAGCGLCLRLPERDGSLAREALAQKAITPEGVYLRQQAAGKTIYTHTVLQQEV